MTGMTRMLLAASLAIASTAQAQQAAPEPQAIAAQAEPVTGAAFGEAVTLADADLQTVAGREDVGTQIASADQRNTVSNNSVNGTSTTGAVQIDGYAFQNLQGMAVINANSGNNVAINSAMNITINIGGPQ